MIEEVLLEIWLAGMGPAAFSAFWTITGGPREEPQALEFVIFATLLWPIFLVSIVGLGVFSVFRRVFNNDR